jgi:hypothetical protein
MPEDSGFLVEEFIQSITTQLDRVQDMLRLKALTRPLTYALKDFALDLNVFVDMDSDGNVRFRTSGPNESGASVVRLGFTTITKPMIEENTVSLALTKSPTLDEMGLERDERRRLEQLGIRNAAQLQQLRQSTGTTTIARYTGVSVDRLRQAMLLGQPFIREVKPESEPSPAPPLKQPPPIKKPPVQQPPIHQPPVQRPPFERPAIKQPPIINQPVRPAPVTERPSPITTTPPKTTLPSIRVAPDVQRLRLSGGNLLNPAGSPSVRLAGQALSVDVVDDDEMIIQLPSQHQGGALEIELPHGETLAYELSLEDSPLATDTLDNTEPSDPWSPRGGESW